MWFCPVCKGNDHNEHKVFDGFVTCQNCKAVSANPMPDEATVKSIYDTDRSEFFNNQAFLRLREYLEANQQTREEIYRYYHEIRIHEFKKQAGTLWTKDAPYLDVGSSTGVYLAVLRDYEMLRVLNGVESNEYARKEAIDKLGIQTYSAIEELPSKHYQLVSLWDLLEHLPDPVDYLVRLRDHMRQGGIIQIRVPNYRSVLRVLSRKRWIWHIPSYHLVHYTPYTLEYALKRAEYSHIKVMCRVSSSQLFIIQSYLNLLGAGFNYVSLPRDTQFHLNRFLQVVFKCLDFLTSRLMVQPLLEAYATVAS